MTKIRDLDHLVDVASRMFAQKGYTELRLEDIAAEFGVLKGSLYYHVSDKSDLLYLVLRRTALRMNERLEAVAASGDDPVIRLKMAVRNHLRHFDDLYEGPERLYLQPFVERSVAFLGSTHRAEMRKLFRRYESTLAGILEEAIAAGSLQSDLDPKIAMFGLLGMCAWVPRWYRRGGRLSMDEIADVLIRLFIEGMGTADGREKARGRG